MALESFLVTALPFSADPASTRHLSLFVTHRLTPDGPQGVVADFVHVRDWTSQLASAEITVTVRAGLLTRPIAVTPQLDGLKPDLWTRVFPPQLPVLPWQVPDPTSLPWRTFPAHRMQSHALLAHTLSLLSSPVSAPTIAGNALATSLGNDVFSRTSDYYRRGQVTIAQLLEPASDGNPLIDRLDELTTAFLDRAVSPTGAPTLISGLLSDPETSSALLLAGDVHMARQYYQRAEEQGTYQATPSGESTPPVVQVPPDFHRRASLLGDLSPLLRQLGLIIDVTVDDVSTLAGLTDISAAIAIAGLENPISNQPRVSCSVVGPTFTAVSSSGDYVEGMLRLGDEDAFTVLDLDPDASALKLEQYVRNLPRMAASENNGDAGSSAPSTLRAMGFAIARNDRATQLYSQLDNAPARDANVVAGQSAPLHLEDVARGVRLEVWDDVSAEWHSLHRRRLSVEIVDAGTVLAVAPDTAFLQGASLTQTDGAPDAPLNAHEVLAGWDGWSLSASRPGKRLVHDSSGGGGASEEQHADPLEKLEDPATPAPDADNPVATLTAVEPGTLPRLRYGRNYSFRAWAVDLAGNSSPHAVAGPSAEPSEPTSPVDEPTNRLATSAATQHLAGLSTDATRFTGAAAPIAAAGVAALRKRVSALNPPPAQGPTGARVPGLNATSVKITGVTDLDRLIVARGVQRATPVASRQTRIEQAVAIAAPAASELVQRTDTQVAPSVLAKALASAARVQPWLPSEILLPTLTGVVTTPRPFLRWEPVLEPTVVPRNPYTEGESLFTVVIRSGVEGPGPDGVTMTVIAPDVYVPAVLAAHPEFGLQWVVEGQRHLLPPKTSQFECELHGLFDAAFGSADPAAVKAALAIAIRESGTLLDTTIADPATPGARIPQPGVTLVTGPTADAAAHDNPDDIARGDGLSRGQYVIHDVDSVVVPYLPDPLADGVAFVFPDGGTGTELHGLLAVEGTQLPYSGDWPDRVPWRLVLDTGTELAADAEADVVTFSLPPGNQLRANLSSSLRPDSLDLLGIWRSLPAVLQSNAVLAAAAADGWLWWLTPATQLRFVHAVPRPLKAPRFTILKPMRGAGSTSATLFAGVDLHAPSTGRLDIQASWSEWSDDVSKPAPVQITASAAVGHTTVGVDEDLVVLAGADADTTLPDGTALHVHGALHHLGDTKHRAIDYSLRATTRFQEYFDPRLVPTVDDVSVVGPVRTTNVLSSARPDKALVRDLIPLLRWQQETEPGQPFAVQRSRRSGVRIYLDRPWYSSGDDELLAVVLQHGSDALTGDDVSQWGADPVFVQDGPADRGALPLSDLLHTVGLDDRVETARPVLPPATVTLVDLPGRPPATVLAYRPEFSTERGMWFVDVAVDPGTAFWPFLRLTVARYQANSLPGLELSKLTKCDFVQLLPTRTVLLSRPDAEHARIVVTGPVGTPSGIRMTQDGFAARVEASRTMLARLERRVPSIGTDLGWTTVGSVQLPVSGVNATTVSWEGAIDLPTPLAPQRPGSNADWRVVVEEWEKLPADTLPYAGAPTPPIGIVAPPQRLGTRIVYADQLPL